jgi:serine/threonine protein kinase
LGAYEVLQRIGEGGNGIVLKALDPALNRIVAIKVMAPHFATSATARKRFLREAQAAAAVAHDHVVTIHAVDENNGLPYLVMQYVAGLSLQDRLDQSGPLELKEILRIGMQTASGLAAAHAQGLVHRDIKPANILLENGVERVKITDFGLARAADEASLTQSGVVAGTPQYMAPEQARGETLDHRADLFSLGSVLYAMCTGVPPFRATTTMGVLKKVSDESPKPIKDINPEIPDWLVAVIDKLHAKDPADRYQSATEVANELGQHLAQLQHAGWTPLPEQTPNVTPVAALNPSPAITSLTICPTCGSQLYIPERMVGRTVDCPQCGKPFQVAEASQEIEVIKAAGRPLLHAENPRFRRRPWFWPTIIAACLLVGCCALPLGYVGFWTLAPHTMPPVETHALLEAVSPPPIEEELDPFAKTIQRPSRAERIVGTWTIDVIDANPKPSPGRATSEGELKATITFEKEKETGAGFFGMFKSSGFDQRFKSGAYKLGTGTRNVTPFLWIELLPDNDKQHYRGIYEFRGNTVWMCFSPGEGIPDGFAAPPGSGRMVLRLQREKE